MSERAVERLREAGACADVATILDLPFASRTFDLVCAMDVIEHVEDDVGALSAFTACSRASSRLLDLGLWYLANQRERAMWWYNRVFMPLAVRFQKPLELVEGLIADESVDEVLVVCRAAAAA